MTNVEYAESLRMIADFYEQHPEVKPPYNAREHQYVCLTKGEIETVARAFGSCEKEYSDGIFCVKKDFGLVKFDAIILRDKVCKKKVVGTKQVEERIIPAHIEEITEWECFEAPLLAPKSEPIDIDSPLGQVIRHELGEANAD